MLWDLLGDLGSLLSDLGVGKAMVSGALGGITPFLIFYTIGQFFLPPVWAESGDIAILLMGTVLPAGFIGALVGGIVGLFLMALLALPSESNWGFVFGYLGGLFLWVIFAFWGGII